MRLAFRAARVALHRRVQNHAPRQSSQVQASQTVQPAFRTTRVALHQRVQNHAPRQSSQVQASRYEHPVWHPGLRTLWGMPVHQRQSRAPQQSSQVQTDSRLPSVAQGGEQAGHLPHRLTGSFSLPGPGSRRTKRASAVHPGHPNAPGRERQALDCLTRPSDRCGPGRDPGPPCAFKVSMFNVSCNSH